MKRWAFALCVVAACAGSPTNDGDSEGDDSGTPSARGSRGKEAPVTVQYRATAKGNWQRGEEEYADENYLAAQKYFQYIRRKFPYSAYATRAEMRVADCLFKRARHLEAIDAYQNFIRLHATHSRVSYAMLMSGKAYYEQIPSDWFMLPPSYEKDQTAVRDAATALKAYVDRFPDDEGVPEGKKLLADVRSRLMEHERYAADFYRRIDKPKAYVGRLEVIRRAYPDVGLDDGLLFEMVEVYVDLEDLANAKSVATDLEQKFATSPKVAKSKKLIAQLSAKTPAKKPAKVMPEPPEAEEPSTSTSTTTP